MRLASHGYWMGEEDLRSKYATKPKRLESILRNAKRWTCPVSEMELFEDMSYKTIYEHNRLNKMEHKRNMDTTETLKTAKKPKTIASVATVISEEVARDKRNEPKPFSESQGEAVKKHKVAIAKVMDELASSRDEEPQKEFDGTAAHLP